MIHINLKRLGIIAGLSLSLFVAGCGTDKSSAQSENDTNISEEMNYTITGIEPGAGQSETNDEAIEIYDSLSGWDHHLSSTGAMLTELDEAIDNEEPIVISAWSPHYMFAKWDIKYLDDPEGVFGEKEAITTLARQGLEDDKPEAYQVFEQFQWDLADVEEALLQVEETDVEVVAQEWVDENQDAIDEWTEGLDPVDGESFDLAFTLWDAESFFTHVADIVLEDLGYSVTLTSVDAAVLFEALANGESDATLSAWLPITHNDLYAQYEDDLDNLGPHVNGAKIGLAVPAYLDIDSIEDLEPK